MGSKYNFYTKLSGVLDVIDKIGSGVPGWLSKWNMDSFNDFDMNNYENLL